ncbi:MAG: serpin family protein [Alphaproteobacteria bacterium]
MKNFFAVAVCAALVSIFTALKAEAKWTADDADIKLAVSLLKNEAQFKQSNFIISPISVYTAATILANGSDNQSLEELREYLLTDSVYVPLTDITDILKNSQQAFSDKVVLNNSLWGNNFNAEFESIAGNFAAVKALPLKTDNINKWLNVNTKGEISGLVKSDWVDKGDIYYFGIAALKDKWEQQFDWRKTKSRDFYSFGKNKPVKVNTMYARRFADYYEDEKMQAVRLWFTNGDFIEIFLPRRTVRFKKFIQDLNSDDLKIDYKKADVKVYIPRLELKSQIYDLRDIFAKYHIKKIFESQNQDFDKLSNEPHTLKEIFHIVSLRLDETGSEALPVPYDDEDETKDQVFGELPPKVFNADRPFIFMVNRGLLIGSYTQGEAIERLMVEEDEW